MTIIKKKTYVIYKKNQMFDLVSDIESYPIFLPMCKKLIILSKKIINNNVVLISDMTVGNNIFSYKLRTKVILNRNDYLINVEYINGPFKYLKNYWIFLQYDKKCQIEFYIEYNFKNILLEIVYNNFFDNLYTNLSLAFKKRAIILYG